MNTTLVPYLNFDGRTAEAMKFYHAILGGELRIQTFADAGMADPPEMAERVMHADLTNDAVSIMASDTHPGHSAPLVTGNNVHLSLIGSDEANLTRYFNRLSEGGTVDMPLEKQFWGDTFGMLTDQFGVHWMVNISAEKPE
jgi:PhnB protein